MLIERSPFLRLDRSQVLGYLKAANSRDPDVLHAHKASLVSLGRFPKVVGIYLMVLGGLLTVTILGAFLGVPLLVLGGWTWRRGVQNGRTIDSGYAEFATPARA